MSSALSYVQTHTHTQARTHTRANMFSKVRVNLATATAKSGTNINTNTSTYTLTQLHFAERKWVMHSLPLKRPSSSVTTLFTWRWLKQTDPAPPALLANLTGSLCGAPPSATPYAAARTGQITDEHASLLKTWRRSIAQYTYSTHTRTRTCWHVHVSWPNIFNWLTVAGWWIQRMKRADANVNMHSNGQESRRLQGWRKCNEMLPDICTHACMATPKC